MNVNKCNSHLFENENNYENTQNCVEEWKILSMQIFPKSSDKQHDEER